MIPRELVERIRGDEPSTRALFLYGSFARKDQGAFSDIDIRVVTAGAPVVKARMTVIDHDGKPTHVSIGARSIEAMEAAASSAAGWAFMAGFVDVAVTLDDPHGVRERIRSALVRPARLESESGLDADLEDIVEHLAKTRNAFARGAHDRVMRHAWNVAKNVRRALVPFGPVEPARRGGETEERAVATMPPRFRADLALASGETPWARAPLDVVRACGRVAVETVAKLEKMSDPPAREPLRSDLVNGRVRALVERLSG